MYRNKDRMTIGGVGLQYGVPGTPLRAVIAPLGRRPAESGRMASGAAEIPHGEGVCD